MEASIANGAMEAHIVDGVMDVADREGDTVVCAGNNDTNSGKDESTGVTILH